MKISEAEQRGRRSAGAPACGPCVGGTKTFQADQLQPRDPKESGAQSRGVLCRVVNVPSVSFRPAKPGGAEGQMGTALMCLCAWESTLLIPNVLRILSCA